MSALLSQDKRLHKDSIFFFPKSDPKHEIMSIVPSYYELM